MSNGQPASSYTPSLLLDHTQPLRILCPWQDTIACRSHSLLLACLLHLGLRCHPLSGPAAPAAAPLVSCAGLAARCCRLPALHSGQAATVQETVPWDEVPHNQRSCLWREAGLCRLLASSPPGALLQRLCLRIQGSSRLACGRAGSTAGWCGVAAQVSLTYGLGCLQLGAHGAHVLNQRGGIRVPLCGDQQAHHLGRLLGACKGAMDLPVACEQARGSTQSRGHRGPRWSEGRAAAPGWQAVHPPAS